MRLYARQPVGTVPRARQLRRDAPEPERRLLRALRESFPTLKWRHQAPVGPFYTDILCFSAKLVIEVDGDTHADRETRDTGRTKMIEAEGFHVLRFTNTDVMKNTDGVIASISLSLRERSFGSDMPPACPEQRGALLTQNWARAAQPRGKGEDIGYGKGSAE